jgi:two-component sensor histidine kinase
MEVSLPRSTNEAPPTSAAQLRLLSSALGELARAGTQAEVMEAAARVTHRACGAEGLAVQMGGAEAVHWHVTEGRAAPGPAPVAVAAACAEALKGRGTRITSIDAGTQPGAALNPPSPRDVLSTSVGAPDAPRAGIAAYWLTSQQVDAEQLVVFEAIANATAMALDRLSALPRAREANGHDVLSRKDASATSQFFEFQRQVRGLLASIRSIVRRSARSATSPEDQAAHLEGRLGSLARVHGFLVRVRESSGGVDLEELVWSEFLAQTITQDQAQVAGPSVRLSPKAAEALGLTLHELTTNSIKFGGLSHPSGRVAVTWNPDDRRAGWIRLDWRESPPRMPVPGAGHRGFGFELIEKTLPYELGAQTTIGITSEGLSCTLSFPPDAVGQRERA